VKQLLIGREVVWEDAEFGKTETVTLGSEQLLPALKQAKNFDVTFRLFNCDSIGYSGGIDVYVTAPEITVNGQALPPGWEVITGNAFSEEHDLRYRIVRYLFHAAHPTR